MAPHNEEDDPAVYRAGTYKKSAVLNGTNGSAHGGDATNGASGAATNGATASTSASSGDGPSNGNRHSSPGQHESPEATIVEDGDDNEEHAEPASDEDEEDSTLLTVQPGFNRLLLVLRDERVMRFVKYVSAAADGSRWDVCAEYEVGVIQEEAMDED